MLNFQNEMMEKSDIRDQYIDRIEVLDKVKQLFLIPEMLVATTGMLAEYFNVGVTVIQQTYYRNRDEIKLDGVISQTGGKIKDFLSIDKLSMLNDIRLSRGQNILFPKRAVLRIAMLLRDSDVAKEIRTQLLNTFEHADEEQRTTEINNETELRLKLADAVLSGDFNTYLKAQMAVNEYTNRHVQRIEEENAKLSHDNKLLTVEILKWSDRKLLNRGIRCLAGKSRMGFGEMFNKFYTELYYKHGISLRRRGNSPFINHIRESEWEKVQQTFCAFCEAHGFSPTNILNKVMQD